MALQSATSRRYAMALLDSVTPHGPEAIDGAARDLTAFATAVGQSFDLRNSLLNPLFTTDDRSKVLGAVLRQLNVSTVVERFLKLLIERDRIAEVRDIAASFVALANQRRGRVRAEVQSAAPLAPDTAERLRRALEKSTGKTIELDVQVDPSLLGGLRARVGSMVFDGTIRAELERLRNTLVGDSAAAGRAGG